MHVVYSIVVHITYFDYINTVLTFLVFHYSLSTILLPFFNQSPFCFPLLCDLIVFISIAYRSMGERLFTETWTPG